MIKPYPYQQKYAEKIAELLCKRKIILFYGDTRVGKTPISLQVANELGVRNVLFVTKKRAIGGVEFFRSMVNYNLTVINYESLHKVTGEFDLIIADESHTLSAFPKPSLRAKQLRKLCSPNTYVLLLTATPALESPSQYYHQFAISPHAPLQYKNFYAFANEHINIETSFINGRNFRIYKKLRTDSNLLSLLSDYIVRLTKEEVNQYMRKGFGGINETIHHIKSGEDLDKFRKIILRQRGAKLKDGTIVELDTPSAIMHAESQLSSGVLKINDRDYRVFDTFKGDWIKKHYSNKKIAIYHQYIGERLMIEKVFGKENTTNNAEEFNITDKLFVSQFQSGSMGVNLSAADYIIFINIPYSAVNYEQARERGRLIGKQSNSELVWVFKDNGIEDKIMKVVKNKIDYNTKLFKKDYRIK